MAVGYNFLLFLAGVAAVAARSGKVRGRAFTVGIAAGAVLMVLYAVVGLIDRQGYHHLNSAPGIVVIKGLLALLYIGGVVAAIWPSRQQGSRVLGAAGAGLAAGIVEFLVSQGKL